MDFIKGNVAKGAIDDYCHEHGIDSELLFFVLKKLNLQPYFRNVGIRIRKGNSPLYAVADYVDEMPERFTKEEADSFIKDLGRRVNLEFGAAFPTDTMDPPSSVKAVLQEGHEVTDTLYLYIAAHR